MYLLDSKIAEEVVESEGVEFDAHYPRYIGVLGWSGNCPCTVKVPPVKWSPRSDPLEFGVADVAILETGAELKPVWKLGVDAL